tara:strand:+ start:1888 stop:2427 length:540 start_codon:yes stop_codon:yes gene_type:complete
MSYQGEQVNFSQPTQQQFNGLMMEVGRINSALYQYPQADNLSSAKSDTDIWNHLNRYVWGKSGSQSSPKGSWSADPNAIVPNITKNTNAIKRLEAKINSNKDEHSDFHTKLTNLGNSQDTAKTHRDSLESKIQSHSHDGGVTCNCEFWDIPCQMGCGVEKIIPYVLIGGVALLALRKKK